MWLFYTHQNRLSPVFLLENRRKKAARDVSAPAFSLLSFRLLAIAPKPPPEGGKGPRASGESHRNASLRTQKPQGERGRGREFQNMKKSKKLAILGLSAATAAAAATGAVSSFAWFASSTTVEASGMKIKATSNNVFLQIRNSNTTAWNNTDPFTSAGAALDVATVSPAAVVNSITSGGASTEAYTGGMAVWTTTTSNDQNSATKGDAMTYKDISSTANPADVQAATGYTLKNTFTLRLRPTYKDSTNLADTQPKSGPLTAAVDWNGTAPVFENDPIAKAVSVLVYTGTKGELFTVGDDGKFARTADTSSVNLVESMEAGIEDKNVTCSVYVFFNGENENCKTTNIKVGNEYAIKVSFSVAEE